MNKAPKESQFEKVESTLRKLTGLAIKIAIIVLFSVVSWRMAWSTFSLDLSKFDFSDLLAMILALFAMAMSVAFYFKSTDSRNQFYDNIYNFTQKTSEILGRIEERFGERLKHIDEGYGRIQSRFDGIQSSDDIEKAVKETEGKEEEEKKKLEETNNAMREMLENLAQKARLEQAEKEEFYHRLEELTNEKDLAQQRIQEIEEDRDRLQHQLRIMEIDMMESMHEFQHPIIVDIMHHPEIREMLRYKVPMEILQNRTRKLFSSFPSEILEKLRKDGIINERSELTSAGKVLLNSMFRKFDNNSNKSLHRTR